MIQLPLSGIQSHFLSGFWTSLASRQIRPFQSAYNIALIKRLFMFGGIQTVHKFQDQVFPYRSYTYGSIPGRFFDTEVPLIFLSVSNHL
jgi:hypothetical protein